MRVEKSFRSVKSRFHWNSTWTLSIKDEMEGRKNGKQCQFSTNEAKLQGKSR